MMVPSESWSCPAPVTDKVPGSWAPAGAAACSTSSSTRLHMTTTRCFIFVLLWGNDSGADTARHHRAGRAASLARQQPALEQKQHSGPLGDSGDTPEKQWVVGGCNPPTTHCFSGQDFQCFR